MLLLWWRSAGAQLSLLALLSPGRLSNHVHVDKTRLRVFLVAALALFYLQRYEEAMAAYDVAIHLAPGKESLLTARAESKAALLERTMADMYSSAPSASATALPEKLHRPPSSTCVPKGCFAHLAAPLPFEPG